MLADRRVQPYLRIAFGGWIPGLGSGWATLSATPLGRVTNSSSAGAYAGGAGGVRDRFAVTPCHWALPPLFDPLAKKVVVGLPSCGAGLGVIWGLGEIWGLGVIWGLGTNVRVGCVLPQMVLHFEDRAQSNGSGQ